MRAADVAMYRAKHNGRARSSLAQPQDFTARRSGEHPATQAPVSNSPQTLVPPQPTANTS